MTSLSPSQLLPPTINDLLRHGQASQNHTVQGWIRSFRQSKDIGFIALNDGSSIENLQIIVDLPQLTDLPINDLQTGASIEVYGSLVDSPAKGQRIELKAQKAKILGCADPAQYPLQKKGHGLDFLRSISHLRSRSNTFSAVFRLRAALAQATHAFFKQQQFFYVHTPIITASDCEGAGEMFEVTTKKTDKPTSASKEAPFFGRPAMLTVSGQLNGESLAYGLGRIYTFGPTFRAENSNTTRHLSEFWMIEPEMAFAKLPENMLLAEAYLKHCIKTILDQCQTDLTFLCERFDKELLSRLQHTLQEPFERLTYTQAIAILEKSSQSFEYPVAWGVDLQSEHERYLVEKYLKKPAIITDYPKELKAFYMYQNDDQKTVAAMDLLVPLIGEMIGGSQREHRLERLQQRLEEGHMPLENYQWYLDLQRFGAVPHAGFGLGFERLVMFCSGMSNIRDVIPFPRAPGLAPY